MEAGGVDRLMTITRQRQRFTPRVVKFASQVLYSMWVHQDLRETYRKAGWKEADFVTKTVRTLFNAHCNVYSLLTGFPYDRSCTGIAASNLHNIVQFQVAARNARPNSPTNLNSTLNRPMASQSGTRYEDRTMQRPGGAVGTSGGQAATGAGSSHHMNNSAGGYSQRVYFYK